MKGKNLKISIGQQKLVQFELVDGYNLNELGSLADCDISIDIKKWRNKRSLTANAYLWVLLDQMAKALNTSKDELYIQVLSRYGTFTHVLVPKKAVEAFKANFRTCVERGERPLKGGVGIVLECYFGSSTYNSLEMAQLLNGVVSEAKELGIETEPQEEIDRLVKMIEAD